MTFFSNKLLFFVFFAGLLLVQNPVIAAKKAKKQYTLQHLLLLGYKNNPLIKEARSELLGFKAQQSEANAAYWWPQGNLTAVVAPSPPARGDAVNTTTKYPDSIFMFSEYGILTRFEIQLVWPLYTFGKLSFFREAAKEGVKIGNQKVEMAKQKVRLLIKKAYYGLQYAQSILFLLEDAEEYLSDAKKRVKNKTDKIKLSYYETEFQARKAQAVAGKKIAKVSLAKLVGLADIDSFELKDAELEMKAIKLKSFKWYLAIAKRQRPEYKLLESAEKAQERLLAATRRTLFPDFFMALFFRHGYASNADDQFSPFAYDPFNIVEGGVFLGMRWSLDIPLKVMRIRKKEAHLQAFQYKRQFAQTGMFLQLRKAYQEAVSYQKMVKHRTKGKQISEQWITRVMLSYTSGLVEVKEVTDALTASGQANFQYLDSIFKFQMAVSELEKLTGITSLSGKTK